jgi:hypothetical protein
MEFVSAGVLRRLLADIVPRVDLLSSRLADPRRDRTVTGSLVKKAVTILASVRAQPISVPASKKPTSPA